MTMKWIVVVVVVVVIVIFTPRNAQYHDEYVCLSVHSHTSKSTWPNFTKFVCMYVCMYARSSSDGVASGMLCTSGFLDDVIFSYCEAHGRVKNNIVFKRNLPGGGTIWTSDK